MSNYQRLRDLREDEDMTQKQIAEKLYDTQQHYQLYESGKREPPFDVIIKLAKIYKVSIDYIAGLTNDKGGLHEKNKEEQEILSLYCQLNEKEKGRIIGRIEEMLEEKNNKIQINQSNNNNANINFYNK